MELSLLFLFSYFLGLTTVKRLRKRKKKVSLHSYPHNKLWKKYADQDGHFYLANYVLNCQDLDLIINTHMKHKETIEIFN